MNMNGWSNQETNNFMLWHDDDIYDYFVKYVAYFATLDEDELAYDIEAFSYELVGLNTLPIGFAREAAVNTFNQINWREIGRRRLSWADQNQEETPPY
jgi:hypothetical protein